jgi:hypothetical protein
VRSGGSLLFCPCLPGALGTFRRLRDMGKEAMRMRDKLDDKLTIVGPEPSASKSKMPAGKLNIEALLLMAKYDRPFREALLKDRKKALADSGLELTAGERVLLTNISDEQLSQNIKEFRVPGISRTSLPSWAKAAAVVLLLSSLALSEIRCGSDSPSEPDPGGTTGTHPDSSFVEGIEPDDVRGITPGG